MYPYPKVYTDSLLDAISVADPFAVLAHANSELDECRRRGKARPSASGVTRTTRATEAADS